MLKGKFYFKENFAEILCSGHGCDKTIFKVILTLSSSLVELLFIANYFFNIESYFFSFICSTEEQFCAFYELYECIESFLTLMKYEGNMGRSSILNRNSSLL